MFSFEIGGIESKDDTLDDIKLDEFTSVMQKDKIEPEINSSVRKFSED